VGWGVRKPVLAGVGPQLRFGMRGEAEDKDYLFGECRTCKQTQVIENPVPERLGITFGAVPGLGFGRFEIGFGGCRCSLVCGCGMMGFWGSALRVRGCGKR